MADFHDSPLLLINSRLALAPTMHGAKENHRYKLDYSELLSNSLSGLIYYITESRSETTGATTTTTKQKTQRKVNVNDEGQIRGEKEEVGEDG